jgi:transposase
LEDGKMTVLKEAVIGIDVAKLKNAVAVVEIGRDGEIRYLGESENAPDSVAKLIRKLASRCETRHVCYKAGPTDYGLYRQILALGHECIVVAPSLIPRRSGERVNRGRRLRNAVV